jgi:hypothetical protein
LAKKLVTLLTLAGVFATAPAFAQQNDNEAWDGGFEQKAERRSDVVLGVSGGLLLGNAYGYPNEIDKIDEPAFESNTGFALGNGLSFWLGGALTDWFTFGLGLTLLSSSGSDREMSAQAFLVRVEAFPLYGMGGPLRDLAFFADFGAGSMSIEGNPEDPAEGGFTSVAGFGSAYELLRFGHFAIGPTAQYLLVRSPSVTAHSGILGLRALFYGGPSGRSKTALTTRSRSP